jgi:hemoglobin-like flavoprotein
VAPLFPGNPTEGDLGADHKGAQQREKLLAALAALADLYDPDDDEKMERLDRALASFGRSHAAFARKDGTVRGATWEEYGAVKEALFATLVTAAGEKWKAEYTESWSQAYDYAAAVMVAEQYRSGFAAPRFPRA